MGKKKQALRSIDAPWYRYWQAMYMAFYSRKLYIDVYKRWQGAGIVYLFLLITVLTIPYSVNLVSGFNRYFDEDIIKPLSSLPLLYIQNGEVQFDKPMPYFIKNAQGDVVALIDTTGQVDTIDNRYPHLVFLLSKNKLLFRAPAFHSYLNLAEVLPDASVYTQEFSKEGNEVFSAKQWLESAHISSLKRLGEVLIYPFVLSTFFGAFIAPLVFMALLGQLFSLAVYKFKMQLKDACRLLMVASTPQMVLFFACLTAQITLPIASFIYIAVLASYFSYAVMMVRQDSKLLVHA